MPDHDDDLFETSKMTFGEHLEELRTALIKALVALTIGFLVGLYFGGDVVAYVQTPLKAALAEYYSNHARAEYVRMLEADPQYAGLDDETKQRMADAFAKLNVVPEQVKIDRQELLRIAREAFPEHFGGNAAPEGDLPEAGGVVNLASPDDLFPFVYYKELDEDPRISTVGLAIEEPFVVYIKAALVVGAVLSSPFVFYFIWSFVAAGLYPHEQRYVHIFLPFSLALFLAGAMLAFFVVFRFVLTFLFQFYEWMGIDPTPRITDWLNFVLILPLGFGIAFQLPLVMLFLERIGVFSVAIYLSYWRVSVLVIAVLSMLLTPADPGSMIAMGVPLVILYFGGIALCHFMPKRKTPFGDVID